MATFDSGGSSPLPLDGGAGDVSWFGTGAGDPWDVHSLLFSAVVRRYSPWALDSEEGQIRSRYRNELLLTQEGGHLLEIVSLGFAWFDGTYRIDMVDASGAVWPLLEDGCHSATLTDGRQIRPSQAGRSLIFATPPLGLGVYGIRVTRNDSDVYEIENVVRVGPTPFSTIVDKMMASLPPEVYRAFPERW